MTPGHHHAPLASVASAAPARRGAGGLWPGLLPKTTRGPWAGFVRAIFAGIFLTAAIQGQGAPARPNARVDFNYQIRPLLSDRCFACHGPDEKGRKAKLRLDTREGIFKAVDENHHVVQPGDLAGSELYRRITSTDPEEMMPPPTSHLSVSREEAALVRRWIEQGAEWKGHWAFQPPGTVEVPSVRNSKWALGDLDRFILARLEREGLKPQSEASRERVLRRVTLDLTGLPPTLAEIDAFVADRSTNAYEKVVDRLLASPAYGERMAVEWLDVARYSDTYGYQADRPNHMWPWRDWVISAFNRNVRFNQFITWQIAGDLLPGATREQRMATGFNRNHRQTNEGGSVNEEFRVEYVADRVHTMAGAFLGLTLECARCHDHKFDPVSQKDYYQMFAFFNSTDESGLYSHFTDAIPSPTVLLFKNDAEEQELRHRREAVAALEKELAARRANVGDEFEAWLKANPPVAEIEGLVAHYSFDGVTNQKIANVVGTNAMARLTDAPRRVTGRFGDALQFSGEDSATVEKVADFGRTDPFSFALWMKIPEELDEIVVLHHQQAGSDAGYQGYQLILEEGKAAFGLIHFWPGNALQVRTREKLRLNEWVHLGITYDGSSRASGLRLFVNGEPAEVEVIRDQLFKESANSVPLTLAARFRGRGFKNGAIDELKIFNRELSAMEMNSVAGVGAPERAGDRDRLLDYYLAAVDGKSRELRAVVRKARVQENELINRIPEMMTLGDVAGGRPTYVLRRGAYDNHGDRVEPDAPAAILPMDPAWPKNRKGLAEWLVSPRQPLTSRVIVNRYWQMFFGRGLVLTAENFGLQGSLPTHPELLDWLAGKFMATGWDLKALCKTIVTSATYRQSTVASPALLARDPDNILLARGPRTRLTAEMLRDSALSAAGLLVRKVGGPSVKPYQPEGVWEDTAGSKYEADKGENLYRRSLYTFWKRTAPQPAMVTFDAAERNSCIVRRQSTSTPLQALVLLNDTQFFEAARKIGERAMRESGPQRDARLTEIFRLLTGRRPTSRELSVLGTMYEEQLTIYRGQPAQQKAVASVGEAKPGENLDAAELAALANVASALLSFDEAIMKR